MSLPKLQTLDMASIPKHKVLYSLGALKNLKNKSSRSLPTNSKLIDKNWRKL